MGFTRFLVSSAALSALVLGSVPAGAMPAARAVDSAASSSLIQVQHHHHGNGAAVGALLGAGLVTGAIIGSQAANGGTDVYIEEAPPPPPRVYGYAPPPPPPPRDETADEAVQACARGLLDTARRDGAYDSEIGAIDSVRETPDGGHRVRAQVTLIYPRFERTSDVVCRTQDGLLVSADRY
jgi:hypothetical protein